MARQNRHSQRLDRRFYDPALLDHRGGQYGYLWWVPELPGFFNALGSFGQMIYVSRERGLVIVFTAYMPNDVAKNDLERLIRDYVLPATR